MRRKRRLAYTPSGVRGAPFSRAFTKGRYSRKPEMRKKIVTPTSRRAVKSPSEDSWLSPLSDPVCVRTTQRTAIARSESSSGKRGWPGGGATTGGASATGGSSTTGGASVNVARSIDADGGTRTPKGLAHRVLSAARLPVPPHPPVPILGGCRAHGGRDFGAEARDLLGRVVADGNDEAVETVVGREPGQLL